MLLAYEFEIFPSLEKKDFANNIGNEANLGRPVTRGGGETILCLSIGFRQNESAVLSSARYWAGRSIHQGCS